MLSSSCSCPLEKNEKESESFPFGKNERESESCPLGKNENECESKTTSIKSSLQFSSSDLSKQFEVWSHLVIEVIEEKIISGISPLLIGDGIS